MNNVASELFFLVEPLILGLSEPQRMRAFSASFGFKIDDAVIAALTTGLAAKAAVLDGEIDSWVAKVEAGTADGASIGPVISLTLELLVDFASSALPSLGSDFVPEVIDQLISTYLNRRNSLALNTLRLLGVCQEEIILRSGPHGRDLDYTRVSFNWYKISEFITDTDKWANDTYGWGGAFNHVLLLRRVLALFDEGPFGMARTGTLPQGQVGTFLSRAGAESFSMLELPLVQSDLEGFDAVGQATFKNEAGFKLVPSGDAGDTSKMGLALGPYAKGSALAPIELWDGLVLTAKAVAEGPYLKLTPDKVSVIKPSGLSAAFEFSLRKSNNDGSPLTLAEVGGTRVQAQALVGTVGGNLGGDLFVAAGVEKLQVFIDVSGDGLLGALISDPITVDVGTLILGWRHGRGVYFEGGANTEVTVPLNLELGPVNLYEVRVGLDLTDGCGVRLLVTGDASIGPVFAALEDTGVVMRLSKNDTGQGMLGFYDPSFELVPPSGYALALDAAPIVGGGYLSVQEDEYRGALALQFESIGFSAFAILNTKLPGGQKGFSLAASIFASFNLPLGYGFFLTGLGGVIGINRTVNVEALREVLYAGRMDNLLFPADPIANARTILADMAAILPPKEGQFVIGPVARLAFGVPAILEAKVGVVIEMGFEVRVLILGGLACYLPVKEAALVDLHLAFFGAIDFPAKTLSFDATLQGSRILSFPVAGDAAIRSGWGASAVHLAAFGGWHPLFPKPDGMANLRRLSINFGTNNPRVTLAAYMAVTMNSVQFGARADLYAKGPELPFGVQSSVEGVAYFDALIYFNPFQFDVALGGGLSLLVNDDVIAGVGFALRLRGPNPFHLRGDVWVEVCGVEVKSAIEHRWGAEQELPAAVLTKAEVRSSIVQTARLESIATTVRTSGVTFREGEDVKTAIDPVGGLRWVQRIAPLNVNLEKIGESKLDGFKKLSIEVIGTVPTEPFKDDFVRGHFFDLSESERLRAPAYEPQDAGFEFTSQEWVTSADEQVLEYGYEIIPVTRDLAAPLRSKPHVLAPELAKNAIRFTHDSRFRPPGLDYKRVKPPAHPVKIIKSRFVTAEKAQSAHASLKEPSNTLATTIRRAKGAGLNPSIAAYIASTQQ
jgi:hypothetical protein